MGNDLQPENLTYGLLIVLQVCFCYALLQIKNGISDLVKPKHWITAQVSRSFPACSTIQTNFAYRGTTLTLSSFTSNAQKCHQGYPGTQAVHTGIKVDLLPTLHIKPMTKQMVRNCTVAAN